MCTRLTNTSQCTCAHGVNKQLSYNILHALKPCTCTKHHECSLLWLLKTRAIVIHTSIFSILSIYLRFSDFDTEQLTSSRCPWRVRSKRFLDANFHQTTNSTRLFLVIMPHNLWSNHGDFWIILSVEIRPISYISLYYPESRDFVYISK
jgi:hypothetical protein